ncbi:MAG: radical SAM protein [Planctomycetia bacterium]|nr:radical SAM protein [Planctomycetia bacterium]
MSIAEDAADVKNALINTEYDKKYFSELEDWLRADFPLEELVTLARKKTEEHFSVADPVTGEKRRRMRLFAPLYAANICMNGCRYCGFQKTRDIQRRHLSFEEVCLELDVLEQRKFKNILLLTGEDPLHCTTDYYCQILREMVRRGMSPAVEIPPQKVSSYAAMAEAGCRAITLFQETYDEKLYPTYHPIGPKSSFDWRIATYDRAGEGGFDFFGFGMLLGLADPVAELKRMMRQACYLRDRYQPVGMSFSLPRIRQAPGNFQTEWNVEDDLFIRMYCALRLVFPKSELVLSTRETVALRNQLYHSCITYTSAGSHTDPGGYYAEKTGKFSGAQFPITDHRTKEQLEEWLRHDGLVPMD